MSLRIVPSAAHPTSTQLSTSAPSAPGLADPLRSRLNELSLGAAGTAATSTLSTQSSSSLSPSVSANASTSVSSAAAATAAALKAPPHIARPAPVSSHPLEVRAAHWRATQHAVRQAAHRRAYGMGEPIRRDMELNIVRQGEWRPLALGGSSGVSGDILEGRDWSLGWEDVFVGDQTQEPADMHAEMEARIGMNW